MKFRCERDVLTAALTAAARAVSARGGHLPVLQGLLLDLAGDRLTVQGTDLDLTVTTVVTVGADEPGRAVVPSRLIGDIVRSMSPGGVTVAAVDDECEIVAGSAEFSIRALPSDEWPVLPSIDADPVTVPAVELAAALKQVVPAASHDDSRPILTGVLVDASEGGVQLAATDSYRLAVRPVPTLSKSLAANVLLPARALTEVLRVVGVEGDVELRFDERHASFAAGDTTVTTRLIEGDYPPYRTLLPDTQPRSLDVDRDALTDVVKRVKLMARDATPVQLVLTFTSVEVRAVTADVGRAHELVDDAAYSGDDLTVAFNPDFLLDGLAVLTGDRVTFGFTDELKPATLVDGTGFTYLIMPVRVAG